jgi:hypothetical protein
MQTDNQIGFLSKEFNKFLQGLIIGTIPTTLVCNTQYPEEIYYNKYIFPHAAKFQERLESQMSFIINRPRRLALTYKLLSTAKMLLEDDFDSSKRAETVFSNMLKILKISREDEQNDMLLLLFTASFVIIAEYLVETESKYRGKHFVAEKLAWNYMYQLNLFNKRVRPLDNIVIKMLDIIKSSSDKRLELGNILLNIMTHLGILKEVISRDDKKSNIMLELTPLGVSLVSSNEKEDYLFWEHLPMFIPPLPLDHELGKGGYLNSALLGKKYYKLEKIKGCGMVAFNGYTLSREMNYLAAVPLRFDYERFFGLKQLFNPNVENYKVTISESQALIRVDSKHSVRIAYLYDRFEALYKIACEIALRAEPSLKNDQEALLAFVSKKIFFYSPLELDWRTRMYYTSKLSMQTFHLERSLFLLPEESKITLNGVYAMINNFLCLYGYDIDGKDIKNSLSFNAKVLYFKKNIVFYSDIHIIRKAKKGYLFEKWFSEFKRLGFFDELLSYDTIAERETALIIYVDNTTSGLQIDGKLVCEETEVIKALNLGVATLDDIPFSFYKEIADKANAKLMLHKQPVFDHFSLSNMFTAGRVKSTVMSYCYGVSFKRVMDLMEEFLMHDFQNTLFYDERVIVTFYTVTKSERKARKIKLNLEQLDEVLLELITKHKELFFLKIYPGIHKEKLSDIALQIKYEEAIKRNVLYVLDNVKKHYLVNKIVANFAKILLETIRETLPNVHKFFKLMQQYGSLLNRFNRHPIWNSLTGDVTIQQIYRKTKKTVIILPNKYGGYRKKRRVIRRSYIKDSLDRRRTRNGIMANFTHTQDACLFRAVIKHFLDNFSERIVYGGIHDAYAIHPSKYHIFVYEYRKVFKSVFSEANIQAMYDSFVNPDTIILAGDATYGDTKALIKLKAIYKEIGCILVNNPKRTAILNDITNNPYLVHF